MEANPLEIPVKPGLWSDPAETGGRSLLLGGQCPTCGEIFFPRKQDGECTWCHHHPLQNITLGTRGKIHSFTVVMQRPPVYYQGEVPYALGFVELPEGVRVETLFTGCDPQDIRIGLEAELIIEPLYEDDEGKQIMTYKFRPVTPTAEESAS